MAQSAPCCLPGFGSTYNGPKRPVSVKTRTSPSHNLELLSAWNRGQLSPLLQAAWALLLHRYTGSEDICFGYQHIGVDHLIRTAAQSPGIANLSTFRVNVNENDSLNAVLDKVVESGELGSDCETYGSMNAVSGDYVLFNTILMIRVCHDSTKNASAFPVQSVLPIMLPEECRVRLHVKILPEEIGIFFEAWNNDMPMEQLKSVANVFEQILAKAISAEDIPVAHLDIFPENDWARVSKFNSVIPENHDRCIHEAIHEQTLLRPDSEAVCAWDGSLTYKELDIVSSKVACYLQEQGVGPEVRVALCFDKSKWNIVAMLGVLRAGGAFVPLDPTHPITRLRSLVQSVQAKIMLCSRNCAEKLQTAAEMLISLDDDTVNGLPSLFEGTGLLTAVKSYNAAYVIFTSGSTGQPKGTLLEHHAYFSGAVAHAPTFSIDSNKRVLQFAAHTFDASLVDILTSLMHGACICIPSEEARLSEIVKVINDMRINHACLTPSFVEFIDPSTVPGLKTLILAGEAMSPAHLAAWSHINLINGYGPTESSVAAVVNSKITPSTDCRDIGFPVGVRCWVVNPTNHDQLVPVGCPGELVLEGPTLARCYINNPEKTEEAFIYDPAWTNYDRTSLTGRRRFYKTGDLVRYNSEAGSLTYIGRKDTQVKFHGQRIELGEIENHLGADSNIKHCIVFLPKSGFSEGKLVAVMSFSVRYDEQSESDVTPLKLLGNQEKDLLVAEVRDRLSARLPTYMVPSVWLCVEALPMLASGKLDRKATANWVGSMEEDPDLLVAEVTTPRSTNATEDKLASIWSRVLNIPTGRLNLDESFLSLGGDSIAAITCIGLCKKKGMRLTVQDILRSKSIRELSTRVKEVRQRETYQETIEQPFDLSPIQKLHFMARKEGQGYFNQSIFTRLDRQVNESDLRRAIETLIMRHSMLRARLIDLGDGSLQQRITQDVAGSYRWRAHSSESRDQIDQAISESQSCIDAFVGPVFAVDLFYERGNGNHNLLSMVAHHLVVDIVSWRIILEDLEDLLLNPLEKVSQNSSLPFQAWCRLQDDQCQRLLSEKEMNLEDLPAPDLAYWGMENTLLTYGDVDCESFELDQESSNALLLECHKSLQTEPIDIFLAVLLHAFGQTFADRALPVIYNEGHGREPWDSNIDISRTVGWFTTLYPIFASAIVSDDPVRTVMRVKDLRRQVSDNGRQQFTSRMFQGHHCPLEITFNYVGQHRDLQKQDGLFQLMDHMAGETGQGGGAADFGKETPRFGLFEISALAVQGRLRFTFSFNRFMQRQERIRDWISCCHYQLKSLGEKLQSLTAKPTLSDFPMLSLTYEGLDKLLSEKLPRVGIDSPDHIEDIYPCSRMQQGILLSQSRDSSLYAVHDTFEVRGVRNKPDLDRLRIAWQRVVSHHAMLRTVFVENLNNQDLFCQVVLKTFDSSPTIVKCSEESDVLPTLDRQQPMDYRGYQPAHRLTICQTAAGKLFCRLELSHAAMDGASISIIVRDLQLAYNGRLETDHKPLFKDFIQYLQNSSQKPGIDYWCSYLSNMKPCHFPVLNDGNTSVKQLQTIRLNFGFYKELQGLCEKSGLTLSTAFSAAWGLTLRAFCGSDDVCFSYMASLRDVPVEEIASTVGPIINILACRMKVPGTAILKDVLHQVQSDNMENFPYRHSSLIDIQHALELSDTSLFNSGLSYRKLPATKLSPKDEIRLSEVGAIHDPAEFPVYVNIEATDNDAYIDLNYWTTTLSEGQANNVANTFLRSLENIVHHQDDEICAIDCMSEQDKQQIATWNNKTQDVIDNCVHEILDEKAMWQPDDTAIIAWDGKLTYSRLKELSTLLATYLTKLGVSPGLLVPIDFEKSVWAVVAILAVLKAGGICVPMDKIHSSNLVDKLIADNEAQVALASPVKAQLLEGTIPYVIPVGKPLFDYLPASIEMLHPSVKPLDGAYVVFTAGGSGDPKPVLLNHRVVLTRAQAFSSALGINTKTKMFQLSAYTSDLFLQEIFSVFMRGGCVCIPSDDNPDHLLTSINALHANFLSLTPSIASLMRPSDVPEVQVLALSGESLTNRLRETWATKVKLHTLYGAAECYSGCIHCPSLDESNETRRIGLGSGCKPWLVDPSNHNALVPIGCIGELVIEGPVLAHGYLHDKEQTGQCFIEDPIWSFDLEQKAATDSEEMYSELMELRRMFKTGDLARYNSDGSLVYMGRKDQQPKSGLQANAWPIEQCIYMFLPADNHCAVEPIEYCNKKGTIQCLAVFLLFETGKSKEIDGHQSLIKQTSPQFYELVTKLHAQLLRHLPSVQVPSLYVPVSRMPLTPAGKLDRQLLRIGVQSLPESSRLELDIKSFYESWRSKIGNPSTSPSHQAYWKEYLAEVEPCIFPSLTLSTMENKFASAGLAISNAAKLHAYCESTGVTTDVLLQIVWGLVLRCYTGLEEVCFGYCVAEQDENDSRFMDVIPSRFHLKDSTELEVVARKRRFELSQMTEYPISLVESQKELGADEISLFNTVMKFKDASITSSSLHVLPVEPSKFIITVNVEVSQAFTEISFDYSTESLSNANITNIVDCFKHILSNITGHSHPGRLIGEIEFFSEHACQQVREWNTTLPVRPEKCAHEIIEQQVLSHPSSPAICSWDGDFTYMQLDLLSTRLAQHLTRLGVQPEVFVALCFEKSAWAVVAQLAVLKAGGAFASLDPSHPESRLRGLIDDIDAHVVLCSEKYHEKASHICDVAFVVNENTISQLPKSSSTVPAIRLSIHNAAYAIATSGTTGKPKVTVLEHIALSVSALAFTQSMYMGTNTRSLQFSSYTFDVSVLETIITLMTGGCICVPSEEERMNDLSGAIRRLEANFISCPPSITNTLDPKHVPTLKFIITGGEKMTASHVDRWSDRCVINAYGPSESTIVATASMKVDPTGVRINNEPSSIGTAVAGRTWVVDPHNHHRLLPVGAVGEMILEGCNVARGYLNNEQKTNEVFVKDPEWTKYDGLQDILRRKERMYRSGDLVRYNSDGTLCFISRQDTQIKFNGQRIELEEIEQQCLRCLPDGAQVAVEVVTPEAKTVAKCLAAFFTLDGHEVQDKLHQDDTNGQFLVPMTDRTRDKIKGLQEALTETLPSAMMPKLFFPVRLLPFTSSGKLDRRKLRGTVEPLSKEQLRPYVTLNVGSRQVSEDSVEGVLRNLWEEALSLATGSVNAEDSFFGLGGDSFSAMKLVVAANSRGISLTFADIYEDPVFMEMAKHCDTSESKSSKKLVEPFSLLPASVTREELLEEVADQCRVPKESISDVYPCSPVQEGLLTLSVQQNGAYIAQAVFQLTESVDLELFKASWQQSVDELDILRTRIVHTESSNFVQAVLDKQPISWASATTLDELTNDAPDLPEYNGGPLTGYAILEAKASSIRYFVWTLHHALYDGWSVPLVLKRVEDIYSGSLAKSPALPYSLFIDYLLEQDMAKSDEFWKTHFSNPSFSPFPQNKNSLSDAVRVGNRHYSSMKISRTPGGVDFTLPELIRAAWAVVVSAHTNSSDVCFGETLMGRNISLPGVTDIAGPVLTTVPTRIQVDNEIPIVQYLDSVHQLTSMMHLHQHSGLQHIRKLNNDTALACEFQNLLVIQTEEGQLDEGLWVAENNQTSGDFFTHPLVVECKVGKSDVSITVHHDEIVLNSWQTEKLIGQFNFVLQQLLAVTKGERRKLGDLEVFSPLDRKEVALWNQRHPEAVDRCAHNIIQEKCLTQPDAPAICAWDGDLSYREMYAIASSFATYLVSRGIGPETVVPICLDKSVWAIITILAIFISGGAFVPLDPAHPTSRHEEILAEVDARIVLCSPQYHSRYSGTVKTIIPVSKETVKAYSALNNNAKRSNHVTPSNMAYAIFTSGSTGRAKGIIIDHRALSSSAMAFGPLVHLDQKARVFQFASLTFDAAVLEVLATLMHGGCICIPSEDERLNDVVGAIQRMNVTWTFLTPSIASIIEPSAVPSLEVLTCGGEKLSREVVKRWADCVKLINVYGPTETTIFAVLNAEVSSNSDPSYIGHGIPCTLTWIVDAENHDRLSPLGAIGELALEGPALAREYLKNPKKTAEAFVDEPAWMKDFPHTLPSPRRIYKTGDLVRYNPNGSIEYISRKDHQVKLHGQRMELGEIEHRLYEDSHVRHAVVILPKAGPLQQRLVTVLSLNSLHSTTSVISDDTCELISQDDLTRVAYSELIDIQTNLETQLPIYMVPQTWAAIKELPMLISGKLDRKKITAWVENIDESTYDRIMQDYDNIKRGTVESSTEDDEEAPVNAIRNILAQVLNLPSHKIDPTRSFVSLGGDSITGMAVISRARKQGINLKLQNVLRSKSILELTQAVGARASTLHDEGKHGEFFDPSPIQTLYLQSADTLQGTGRFNQSMTVRITRRITPDVVKRALRGILDQHSMLRARFSKSRDGRWQQKIVDDVDSSHRFRIHFVENPREILPKVAESQLCLNIQKGPVFAADLFEVNGDEQVLFLVAHHLCVDMVSWRIVLQDMQEFIESGSLALEKPLSFQNWCHLQLENSKKEDERPKLPFLIESPNLSYWGMENSPNTYGQVKMENFVLDKETTSFILGGCHETLRTETIDVLLSTVVQSFRRVFADRKMPAIYNEGHGRESWDSSIDLSRTVGWFTTLCPLQVDECPDLLDTVKRIKDTRRKITHNDQCFFSQSLLHPTNKNGSTDFSVPLEIMFNYLGQLQQLERDDSLFQHYGETFNEEAFNLAGDMGPDTVRFALFEISAVIIKEQLHVLFTYNRHMKHEEQIQAWISECKQTLEIDVLRLKASAPEPTLSDYPLLPITYDGLQKLVKNLPRVGIQSWDRVEDIYPCSPVQEGIILSQLRDPNAYMFYTIFEVSSSRDSGKIDPTRLRKAWSTVVSRHPVLRTLFIDSNYENGSFDQLVVKGMDDDVLVFECDDSDALNRLDAISLREINTRRASKLLHQLAICKTRSGRVLTKIEINHAIIDGGSIGLLLRDLALAYDNQLSGAPGPLFSDYIKYIRAQSQDQALTHWVQYLYGVRPCHLSFPTGATGGRQLRSLMMSFNRFPELQQFCEKNSVTLANLTLSAWAIVLRSFTGSDDICFGYPSAGRDAPVPGIQAAVGIFINMLCCRVKFTPGQTLFDIFRMVEDDYIKSLPHQSCSLANIQHEIGRQGQTLFNTTISIQNQSAWKDTGAKALSFDLQKAHDPTEYPVTVNVQTGKGGEGILLRYWTDALSENNARNLADSIAKVFTCFIDKPSQLISELELPDGRPTKTYSIVDGQAIDNISLQKMIDSRVNEIISQMLREGMLAIPAVQGMEKRPQNGTLPVKEVKTMPRERDLSDSTLTLTDYDIKSTHFEKKLCKLWSLALPLSSDTVKRHDSFFKLGGDSIAAMKMVSAARQDGLALTVADVFNNPVFEDMLGVVSASNSSPASEPEFQMETDSEKSTEPDFIMPETPPPQEMSVLRTADLDDNTLQVEICPKIGVFRGGIADVLPVTDFQAMSITASQFKSRWMLNYFYLDGKGTLDLRRLRGSILQVVDAFDILRTVFVCFQGQFFQAVLRKVRPNIFVHETEMSLDEYTESLQEEDRRKQAREGEQYVQFYIVKKKDTDQHRILLRISHAQFDGVCLPSILSAIKLGYEGTPLPQVPSFANYMRSLSGIITPKHYQHWTTLLKGSRMTEIVRRGTSNTFQHIGAFAEMKKTIEIQSTILGNITTATVMQAAWAITLAKLCAQSDVVFGLTISGRNAPIPGIESTVGPCLNVIPVRVKFRERWTGLDLLRYIQDQQVANMPFESLGFREIIRHCTDWPDSTYFTTSVFHQSVEYEGQMQMEDITYRMGGAGVIDNFADLILFSKFSSHGKLGVSLGYSLKGPIHSTFAAQILDMVCETAKSLVSNHNIMLPSPYAFRSLPCQAINDIPRLSDEMFLSAHLKNRNISKLLVHSDILTKTWQQVLPHGTEDIQTPFQLDSSFFDLGGDIFNMAQVAWLLDQEGLQVPLEGLLEHPTFLGQMAVLALHNTGHDDSSEEEIIPIEEVPLPSEKPGNWGSIGKAMNLARKVTKWGSVSTRA